MHLSVSCVKAPASDYSIAKQLAASIPENGTVLAPESVATWLPTFVTHPQLLASRGMYLAGAFGAEERALRLGLQEYVAGKRRSVNAPEELSAALARYSLTAIVVVRSARWQLEIARTLSFHHWTCIHLASYDVWTKAAVPALH